jgi:predicted HicB family RNase H-like nuclease
MPRYTTTNIRLPESEYRDLALRAARRRTSLASLVREAVAEYLGRSDSRLAE